MMRKMILAASVALVAMAAPAAAQQYPPGGVSCAADDTTVEVGQTMTVSCTGFDPGTTADFTFFSDPVHLGTATVDDDGGVALTFDVPHVHEGPHHIEVAGSSGDVPVAVPVDIHVAAPGHGGAVTPGGGRGPDRVTAHGVLARTGSDTEAMLARVAVGLIAVGGVCVLASRKRRSRLAGASDGAESVDVPTA